MLRVANMPGAGVGSAELHLFCPVRNSVFEERP